jgi:hypothetical protein
MKWLGLIRWDILIFVMGIVSVGFALWYMKQNGGTKQNVPLIPNPASPPKQKVGGKGLGLVAFLVIALVAGLASWWLNSHQGVRTAKKELIPRQAPSVVTKAIENKTVLPMVKVTYSSRVGHGRRIVRFVPPLRRHVVVVRRRDLRR